MPKKVSIKNRKTNQREANQIHSLLLLGIRSFKIQLDIAVNIKVNELATGTARDISVLCNVRKYMTEPS